MVVLAGVLLLAAVRYLRNPAYIPNPPPPVAPLADDLMDRIDPNTADWQTFAALPAIGEKRAREIVAYRDQMRATKHHNIVFRQAEDLAQVKGIGPSIITTLRPYLVFPLVDTGTTAPTY